MATLTIPSGTRNAVVGIRRTTTASVLLLAGIAAIISYRHVFELARAHGEPQWTAALIPLSVDGMVVASSMSILLASRSGQRAGWLPWTLLIVGSLASLAANVAANVAVAEPTLIGRVIAAWPSFAFVGAYELLQSQLRIAYSNESRRQPVQQTGDDKEDDRSQPAEPSRPSKGKRLQHQAWEWALQNSTPDGALPSGHRIAGAFGRKERWGRMVKQAGLAGHLDAVKDLA